MAMKLLYSIVNLPVRILAMILVYKYDKRGMMPPPWLKGIVEKEPPAAPASRIEAYDSGGKQIRLPRHMK